MADRLIADGAFTRSEWDAVQGSESGQAVSPNAELANYTVLVYMNGSDLESAYNEESQSYTGAASIDLNEMLNGLSGDRVQVIVDWNHGGGSVLGFGTDKLFDCDSLTLDEIADGLESAYRQTGEKLEMVGFDACLLATVETVYLLSPYAKFMVASQELEPGHGWDYEEIFAYLSESSSIDGAELGRAIVDSYKEHAEFYRQEKSITLSVTDLSKMPAVLQALEAFVAKAGAVVSNDQQSFYNLAQGRSKAED